MRCNRDVRGPALHGRHHAMQHKQGEMLPSFSLSARNRSRSSSCCAPWTMRSQRSWAAAPGARRPWPRWESGRTSRAPHPPASPWEKRETNRIQFMDTRRSIKRSSDSAGDIPAVSRPGEDTLTVPTSCMAGANTVWPLRRSALPRDCERSSSPSGQSPSCAPHAMTWP